MTIFPKPIDSLSRLANPVYDDAEHTMKPNLAKSGIISSDKVEATAGGTYKATDHAKAGYEATVTLANDLLAYDGKAKTPMVTRVVLNGKTLVVGKDYMKAPPYSNNVNEGTGTVTILPVPDGNYKGSPFANFTIASTSVSNGTHVQTYGDKGPVTSGMVGTTGEAKRAEAIEVVVLPYTAAAPGSTANAYRSK